jgi:two-component system, cell cycle response regulator
MPSSGEDEGEVTQLTTRAALARGSSSERPWVVVVAGQGNVGKMHRVVDQLIIGRSSDAGLHLPEEGVSRAHARLDLLPNGRTQVVDLGSRNGTFVNGERVDKQVLQDGDKIQIGKTTILKLSYLDATEEALQQNLYDSATRDPLTQLANRRAFTESLEREIAFAKRHSRPLALVAFDVDHFKLINDTFGHPAGDHVLRHLGEVVATFLRVEDVVARVGGEEFAALLRDVPLAGARDCAERLRRTVESTAFEHGGHRMRVTISLGVAMLDAAAPTGDALVQAADRCLYAAKQAGRNRVVATLDP